MMRMIRRVIVALTLFGWALAVADAAEFGAHLDWSRRVMLSVPVNGVVKSVHANVGDQVAKDAVLLRLDPREFDTAVRRAEAELKSRQEQRAEAKREVERAEELYERTVLSDHELQVARIQLKSAEAELEAAHAALSKARLAKERSEMRAPFDAIVLRRTAEVGQTIVSSLNPEAVFVLAEQGHMLARAGVAHSKLRDLKLGDSGNIVADDKQYPGTLIEIGLEPVNTEGTEPVYGIVYRFATGDTLLRKGQRVKLQLP